MTRQLIFSAVSVLLWEVCSPAAAPEVHVDAGKVVGSIRSFQGVNCGPAALVPGRLPDVSAQYRDLRIGLVRTHDFFGPAGRSAEGDKVQVLVCNLRSQPDYRVTVANLPWGQEPFRVKHYRVSNTDRFDPPVESPGQDGKWEITRMSAAPAVEWFVLEP